MTKSSRNNKTSHKAETVKENSVGMDMNESFLDETIRDSKIKI